jgi:hypothetical protein
MTQKMMGVLICLTVMSFVVVQAMYLITDSAWSWLTTVSYSVILAFQAGAFCLIRRPAE